MRQAALLAAWIPFFPKLLVSEITPQDVTVWPLHIRTGSPYSSSTSARPFNGRSSQKCLRVSPISNAQTTLFSWSSQVPRFPFDHLFIDLPARISQCLSTPRPLVLLLSLLQCSILFLIFGEQPQSVTGFIKL